MPREILLSNKHGLQPSMPTCFFCGKETGEIVLFGKKGDTLAEELGSLDGQMPMHCPPVSVEPCDTCKKAGIGLIEVDPNTKAPTGNRWLVKEQVIKDCIKPEALMNQILVRRFCALPPEVTKALGLPTA